VFFTKIKPNKFLLERRPSEGILGGLLGFPSTRWAVEKNVPAVPFKANWTYTNKLVVHQFTHFKLELEIVTAEVENPKFDSSKYLEVESENFDLMTLPTLMRKVYSQAIKLYDY
jgi:A/G-specific adenine glycosylase